MSPPRERAQPAGRTRLRDLLRPDRFSGAAGWTMALRLVGLPFQLLLFLLVARLHPVADVGLFAVVLGLWLAVRSLGPLGFDQAAMRFIPAFRAEGRSWAAAAFVRIALLWIGLPAVLAGAILVAGAILQGWSLPSLAAIGMGEGQDTGGGSAFILLCGLGLPGYVLIGFLVGVVRARRQVIAAQLPELVAQPLLSLAAVGAVALAMPESGVLGSLAAVAVAAWAVALAYLWLARGVLRRGPSLPAAERRAIVRTCLSIGLSKAVTIVTLRAPLFILFLLAGAAAAALFETAQRLALLGTLGTWAIIAAASPMIAEAHAAGQGERLRRLVAGSIVIAAAQTLAVLLVLLVLGDWLLGLFGPAYTAARWTAVILSLAFLANAVGGPVGNAFFMIGRERLPLGFNIAGLAVMAVAVPAGTALAGPTGAAAGFALALLVRDGGMAAMAPGMLGLRPGDLHPGRMAAALLARRGGAPDATGPAGAPVRSGPKPP